jgi:thiamine biosynthesis lipoprotein
MPEELAPGIATYRALGSGVRVVTSDAAALATARQAVDSVLDAIDRTCSRFREDSEISALNAAAGREHEVSPLLAQAIAVALHAARTSAGAVDPTVGHAVKVSGYDRDFAAIPEDGGPIKLVARAVPGWQAIRFDHRRRKIVVPRGVELDLGATGKALAADLAAEAAHEAAGCGVLVSLGGDISVGGEPPAGGWRIQVGEDSAAPISEGAETVTIVAGGLATSSTTVRRWARGGVELHHIIDPRTGLPSGGPWRTVTVAARTCVDANTASTAAIVLGEEALGWLATRGLPARLVDRDGALTRIGGWPQ